MSTLISALRDDRGLPLRDRTRALMQAAPPELVDVVESKRLNWLETPLLLLIALSDDDDWELGLPGVNELGEVLKRRSSELEDQLGWLARKGLVEDIEDPDGYVGWQVTDAVELLLHPASR